MRLFLLLLGYVIKEWIYMTDIKSKIEFKHQAFVHIIYIYISYAILILIKFMFEY